MQNQPVFSLLPFWSHRPKIIQKAHQTLKAATRFQIDQGRGIKKDIIIIEAVAIHRYLYIVQRERERERERERDSERERERQRERERERVLLTVTKWLKVLLTINHKVTEGR
jgi:hypothetical protein